MGGLFGGGGSAPDNSAQIAMQQKQLDLQEKQQVKLDTQTTDQQAAVLARSRAAARGGQRQLMSQASLGATGANGSTTLGSASS